MRIAALICMLGFVTITYSAQIDPEIPSPYDRLSFIPVSSSDFVVIGRVVGPSRTIAKRLSDKELVELDDLGKAIGGVVRTFQVDEVLCSKSDFAPGAKRASARLEKFHIFRTRNQPFHLTVFYEENQRYLMFVKRIPESEQLSKLYKLDEGQTYYETFEGRKGLIPLPDHDPPLVNRLKQFCAAVSPSDPWKKIERLNALAHSPDLELKQAATEAIMEIRKQLTR